MALRNSQQWFTHLITGLPIFAVQQTVLRHFCDITPLPGAAALCGLSLVEDDGTLEIHMTCETCATVVCAIRIPDPPPADAPDDQGGA